MSSPELTIAQLREMQFLQAKKFRDEAAEIEVERKALARVYTELSKPITFRQQRLREAQREAIDYGEAIVAKLYPVGTKYWDFMRTEGVVESTSSRSVTLRMKSGILREMYLEDLHSNEAEDLQGHIRSETCPSMEELLSLQANLIKKMEEAYRNEVSSPFHPYYGGRGMSASPRCFGTKTVSHFREFSGFSIICMGRRFPVRWWSDFRYFQPN